MRVNRKELWIERGKTLRLRAAYLRVHSRIPEAEIVESQAEEAEEFSRRNNPPRIQPPATAKIVGTTRPKASVPFVAPSPAVSFPVPVPLPRWQTTGQCQAGTMDGNALTSRQCTRHGRYDGFCGQHYQTLIEGKEWKYGHRPRRSRAQIREARIATIKAQKEANYGN